MMVRRVCKHFFCTATTPKPWLFVGLGNPGDKYKGTRHNVGFEMIDAFAASQGILVDNIHCKAIFGKGFVDDVPVFLAKPQTYMNLSGESCGPLVAYYELLLDRVVVFHDDMDLPCGVLRLHNKGGHGNHNGLKSVINHFHGNEDFPRLRIGIGKPLGQMNTKAFLLQKFNVTAQERIDAALQEAVVALRQLVSKGLTESGRCFNRKQKYKHRRPCISSSRNSSVLDNEIEATQPTSLNNMKITSICRSDILLSPLFPNSNVALEDAKIELVDNVSWLVSSDLAKVWRGGFEVSETESTFSKEYDEVINYETSSKECPDFDEIEDMRITGNLFYKIDKDSREYEEYSFDFHRRKSYKGERAEGKKENQSCDMSSEVEKPAKKNKKVKKNKEKGSSKHFSTSEKEGLVNLCKNDLLIVSQHEMDSSSIEKRQRRPSFYQLTAPYHEPFCLDIFISRESVRSCIIHRATSKVVAVAHSISKDFKFDLASTKNRVACAAIGEVLAQRALADDIHNVVYTPRKGEKLEGKLQIVLQSIIDNGVDVKVKIKQRKQGY